MDIKREAPKKTKRNVLIAVGVVALTATTLALSNLEARPPSVSRSELWVDSVQRGTMVRQVRAPGTLVPENIRYVAAVTAGRVEARPLRPGSRVTATTILLELSNPEVQLQALEAQRQLTQAEQDLVTLRTTLETNRLNQASQVAQVRTLRANALRDATVIEGLDAKGLSSKNEVERARDQVKELDTRLEVEVQRLDIMTAAMQEQLAKARANLEQVMTQAAYDHMLPLAKRLADGMAGVIAARKLPWHVSHVGARAEFVCSADAPRNGSEAAAAMHGELESVIHLFLLNRGVVITPFHNMTLVSPATEAADVERLVSVLGDCLDELLADQAN